MVHLVPGLAREESGATTGSMVHDELQCFSADPGLVAARMGGAPRAAAPVLPSGAQLALPWVLSWQEEVALALELAALRGSGGEALLDRPDRTITVLALAGCGLLLLAGRVVDLLEVDGIGPAKFRDLKGMLRIEAPAP